MTKEQTLFISEDYTEFFYWVKKRTEAFWNKGNSPSRPEGFTCPAWAEGAKWIGMTDDQIDSIEAKYSINFTPEHRAFLRILHTTDRKEVDEYEEDGKTITHQRSFFYNWIEEEEELVSRLSWPYRTIFDDVSSSSGVWLKSWGPRPSSVEEKERIFADWYAKAPKLLPIRSHRFVVSGDDLHDRPVLSVWGSDTIVYGWDLRLYLLNEIPGHLDLIIPEFDEEDQCYYSKYRNELKEILDLERLKLPARDIPYWKELILYWSSGWSGFGLRSPGDNGGKTLLAIMPTFVPEGQEATQKTFRTHE
ncbi:hypothetical protein [Chitinophaga sancti]|uniref:Knr4/Smi1-like domain-containing protein n=1 Tax=Chitinophaga sancti TaxID=1004 RepID=A0A1K1SGG7_9BACT|nr:hypothetical protein [Chitinophaga sancti]WQD59889.1 hypothetical protein U0033_18535 [Chitinophaga sancti]WQG87981.1 hypothetical protein SR876_23930 [Chitinophaga sancti]SFW83467.1 hypothetical protein SAMN05661012_05414 [Chitinophaga sancti]